MTSATREDRPVIPDRAIPAVIGAVALASAALLALLVRDLVFVGVFVALFLCAVTVALVVRRVRPRAVIETGPDRTLLAAAIDTSSDAVAVTGRGGHLLAASALYRGRFPDLPIPTALPLHEGARARLIAAERAAWRDGAAEAAGLGVGDEAIAVAITRAGAAGDQLVWRFRIALRSADQTARMREFIAADGADRLGAAGVMAALVDGQGRLVTANRAFRTRALDGGDAEIARRPLVELLRQREDGVLTLCAEPEGEAPPLRLVQIGLDDAEDGAALFLMLDEAGPARGQAAEARAEIRALLSLLPLGVALAERDGRLLYLNDAFARVAGVAPGQPVVYPSDLVVKEDKAAVADAVRRLASGRGHSGDLSVRLRQKPEEPVQLSITGVRGLGEAAVLLSFRDSGEETRLKRQVAQATKMQAVGQLAGGVAHDFNNILTAIIGHCDLMLMRRTPGDSDYDDIQQVRHNANRAAGLTRQLLAFSRQQTLRPQVLQLPDVISEVSNLLRRLLGETVTLTVKHGRALGPVRADPGQLEQVIVNLAVNARDAMLEMDPPGGTLTIQTYAVSAAEVRNLGAEILPAGDYTAVSVTDTGTGIPPDVMPKIFEPFFTTKEVGKGTGLGLSTVYGIVKQSGGFIFADSQTGEGTSFVIYLPVHHADAQPTPSPRARPRPVDTWGSGTILLVEDEDMVRSVAERALSRQGYRVLTATNGDDALEVLAGLDGDARIDLLISDVMMPGMDGPTLARAIRESRRTLPVLFMSGYAEEQVRRSIDLDNVAFLPKPFSVQQLAEAAREVLAPA